MARPAQAGDFIDGAVAQLGEHHVRNVGVEGSSPFCSTILPSQISHSIIEIPP